MVPVAQKAGTAVLAMKPLGSGVFFRSEPLSTGQITPTDCLRYAMGSPASVVITGCESMRDLVTAARLRVLGSSDRDSPSVH